jgi:thiopurine S-methyltransferase
MTVSDRISYSIMNKEFWMKKWNSNEIGFNQSEPNAILQQYFRQLNLKPHSRVFVPLCGKSVDMLWLSQQGYHVIGIELSSEACSQFFTEHDISYKLNQIKDFQVYASEVITIFAGDFFQITSELIGPIDAIYDRAALIALPPELRKQYACKIIALAAPSTNMLLVTTRYQQSEMQGPPFSIDENAVHTLYAKQFMVKLLCEVPTTNIAAHLCEAGLKAAHQLGFQLIRL